MLEDWSMEYLAEPANRSSGNQYILEEILTTRLTVYNLSFSIPAKWFYANVIYLEG